MNTRLALYRNVAVLLCGFCCLADVAQAQVAQGLPSGSAYVHQYARPGRASITVYIWGAVELPGTWKVEQEVDLVELLSAVRVPGVGEADPRVKRSTTVRIYRKAANERSLIYETQLDALLTQQVVYPGLHDQDVLQVETVFKPRFGWRDVGAIVGTASSLLLLAIRISEL